jgi:hypothetical protein
MSGATRSARPVIEAASTATVTVGYKGSFGLRLRLFDFRDQTESSMSGSRTIKVPIERNSAGRVMINGGSHPQNVAPGCEIVGGYALTHGISAAFMEEWAHQNADSDLLANNVLWTAKTPADARAKAREMAGLLSGLERMNPKGDQRAPKAIVKADDQKDQAAF